jgi:hypothetical protein
MAAGLKKDCKIKLCVKLWRVDDDIFFSSSVLASGQIAQQSLPQVCMAIYFYKSARNKAKRRNFKWKRRWKR